MSATPIVYSTHPRHAPKPSGSWSARCGRPFRPSQPVSPARTLYSSCHRRRAPSARENTLLPARPHCPHLLARPKRRETTSCPHRRRSGRPVGCHWPLSFPLSFSFSVSYSRMARPSPFVSMFFLGRIPQSPPLSCERDDAVPGPGSWGLPGTLFPRQNKSIVLPAWHAFARQPSAPSPCTAGARDRIRVRLILRPPVDHASCLPCLPCLPRLSSVARTLVECLLPSRSIFGSRTWLSARLSSGGHKPRRVTALTQRRRPVGGRSFHRKGGGGAGPRTLANPACHLFPLRLPLASSLAPALVSSCAFLCLPLPPLDPLRRCLMAIVGSVCLFLWPFV